MHCEMCSGLECSVRCFLLHVSLDAEMASRHRARKSALQIVKTAVVKGADAKRENTTAFLVRS
jgi:hypothetical protein